MQCVPEGDAARSGLPDTRYHFTAMPTVSSIFFENQIRILSVFFFPLKDNERFYLINIQPGGDMGAMSFLLSFCKNEIKSVF